MEIRDKVAVVTGGGVGIGRAVVLRLAREGAAVVVADLDEGTGEAVAREAIAAGGTAVFARADVTAEANVADLIGVAVATFGGLDILVNNAGGVEAPYFPDGDPAHWGRALDLNLRGVMLGIHFGVRAMQARGGGAIVNISSVGGVGFRPYDKPEYGAAKAGVIRLTASLATLAERMGVRVNCICPGLVDIPASRRSLAGLPPAERASMGIPLRPEEIADAAVMFVRDEELAGRVMIWNEGEPGRLVPVDAPH